MPRQALRPPRRLAKKFVEVPRPLPFFVKPRSGTGQSASEGERIAD
jgi:hypothetical protein